MKGLKLALVAAGLSWASAALAGTVLELSTLAEEGIGLYACNAGLMHSPAATDRCGYQNTAEACVPGACRDAECLAKGPCICGSASGAGDFLEATFHEVGGTQNLSRQITAGRSGFNALFDETLALSRQLGKLRFNLGSEVFGAAYFVDLCYQAPVLEFPEPERVICHNGKETILVPESGIAAHIPTHGDTFGFCPGDEWTETLVCHIPKGNPANMQTLLIAREGLNGHLLKHEEGDRDLIGRACPAPSELVTNLLARIKVTEQNPQYPYAAKAGLQVAAEVTCKTVQGISVVGPRTAFTALYTENTELEVLPASEIRRATALGDPIESCRIRFHLRESSGKTRGWRYSPAIATLFARATIDIVE